MADEPEGFLIVETSGVLAEASGSGTEPEFVLAWACAASASSLDVDSVGATVSGCVSLDGGFGEAALAVPLGAGRV